jgi:hypothetical protein
MHVRFGSNRFRCNSRRARSDVPVSDISPYSITSSARCKNISGIVSPSAFAALRFMTSSNLTGAWTGSSLGFSPLRMRSI